MADQDAEKHDKDAALTVYKEACESYRQEDRNIWHTLYVILAANGLLLTAVFSIDCAGSLEAVRLGVSILAALVTLAGLGIITRMFQYAERDEAVLQKIEKLFPETFRKWGERPKKHGLTRIGGARAWAFRLLDLLIVAWIAVGVFNSLSLLIRACTAAGRFHWHI